jgi:hypothetical protein
MSLMLEHEANGNSGAREELRRKMLDGHALRAKDVQFGIVSSDGLNEQWWPAHEWCLFTTQRKADLIGVSVLTHKTGQQGGSSGV